MNLFFYRKYRGKLVFYEVDGVVVNMLNEFGVGGYRGLKDLELDDLKKVNIFVGPNNCGKTSILEAIILSGLFDDLELLLDALVSRYHGFSMDLLESLFPIDYDDPIICLKSRWNGDEEILHTHLTFDQEQVIDKKEPGVINESLSLFFNYSYGKENSNDTLKGNFKVRFEETGDNFRIGIGESKKNTLKMKIPCKFISFSRFDNSNRFLKDLDNILDNNLRQQLIEILQIFDPGITNFELIGTNRIIKLFKEENKKPLTLYDYGNGMYKAFYIGMSALLAKNGILLIDEVEAGIHNKALRNFISTLMQVCEKNNVQLFMTTHSLEAIDVLLEDCKEHLDDTAIYHIRKGEDKTIAKRYSGNKLLNLRNEIGFDVR